MARSKSAVRVSSEETGAQQNNITVFISLAADRMMVPAGIPLLLFGEYCLDYILNVDFCKWLCEFIDILKSITDVGFPAVLLAGSSTGSNEILITVPEKTVTTYEGSSVTIPCSYKKPKDETYTILWFKDSIFLEDKTFNGTIVYSNTEERPQSPGYSSRVEYITDTTSPEDQTDWIKCDLRITDLQMTDSGEYSFRFIGKDTRYMSKALSLKVKGEQKCS